MYEYQKLLTFNMRVIIAIASNSSVYAEWIRYFINKEQYNTRVGGDDQPVQGAVDGDHPVQGANIYEQAGCLTEAGTYSDNRKDCAIKVSFLGYFKKEANVHSPDPESKVTDCSPCDVSVLLVNSSELENITEEVESQSEVDISSLYSILTSTGFML